MRVIVRRQFSHRIVRMQRKTEETIRNPIVFENLKRWVQKHKQPTADTMLLEAALEELRRAAPDLTYNEVLDRIELARDQQDEPYTTISKGIDWYSVWEEKEREKQAHEAAEIVKAALEAGIVKPRDIGLYQRPPPGLSLKDKKEYERRLEEYEKRIEELKRMLEEAKKPPVQLSEQEKMVATLKEWIHTRAVQEGLSSADEETLRTIINPKRSLRENQEALDYEIAAMLKLRAEKKPAKLPSLSPTTGDATVIFGFSPFGIARVRRVRVPQKVPSVCEVVASFFHFDDARREALARKLRNPERHIGYMFDPDKKLYVTIDCTIIPPNAKLDNDGLIILPAPERFERF